ncbi:glycoside hydrolase family 28 protein [Opitutales bacterium ASA1]|uniref:glycoside hydrolase family 28 protein n=1 Tax=Congregicoccus parvus TaxID=3081749 RepID=UPI002B313507|nr:glycoside hydrolase family 28 protein [Opitutales bacterium ASA1]
MNARLLRLAAIAALVGSCAHASLAASTRDYFAPVPESVYAGVHFDMPRVAPPSIPSLSVSITEFGAVGDGAFLNTQAFERAIAHVAERGGGRVVVQRGIWLTGPIVLRSRIQLHTESGALVQFSGDHTLYPLVETHFEGLSALRCQSPLSAEGAHDIAITGEGVFDGHGQSWRPVKRLKTTDLQWQALVDSGGVLDAAGETWWPSAGALEGAQGGFNPRRPSRSREDFERVREFLRPVMVSLRECRNVLLDGPTFQNSPAWNIHPFSCENLIVRHVTVLNPWYSQNGDGIDVDSCRNVVIHASRFDVGDDAMCLKSGKDAEGRALGRPTEKIVVRDNIVYRGHGGFIVGSEMSGGVRDVYVADLLFVGTNVGIRFKSNRGRGGVVENILIENIDMVNIPTEPIRFNLFYSGAAPTANQNIEIVDPAAFLGRFPAVSEETPSFRDITIRDVVCRGAGAAMWIQGLPEMPVKNIRFENVSITATRGARLTDVEGFRFDGVHVECSEGVPLHLENARDVVWVGSSLRSVSAVSATPLTVRIQGPLTERVDLRGLAAPGAEIATSLGPNVAPEHVRLPGG